MRLDRNSITIFVVTVAALLFLAAWWSRERNCDGWVERLARALSEGNVGRVDALIDDQPPACSFPERISG